MTSQADIVQETPERAELLPTAPIAKPARSVIYRTRLPNLALWLVVGLWTLAVVVPVGSLFLWSFMSVVRFRIVPPFTLDAYDQIFDTGRYGVVFATLRIAATVTVIEVIVALPIALWLAKGIKSVAARSMIMALLTIPFFISLASRTIVLRPVLGREGLVNTLLMAAHLTDRPLDSLLFSEFAVHFGLLGPSFPPMVLPIFLAITLIDDDLIEASRDLGASSWRVFVGIILPLSMPGIVAGIIFTFVPLLGETVVPQLLGGANVPMLGASMSSLVSNLNYPAAAALSVIVLVVLGILLWILWRVAPRYLSLQSVFEGMRR
jgi:ABC-type spermidine/putrescine transport system permease subunit I